MYALFNASSIKKNTFEVNLFHFISLVKERKKCENMKNVIKLKIFQFSNC